MLAQRDGRPSLFYRRRTCVATCENLVTVAIGLWYGRICMIPLHCRTPKNPLSYKNLALIFYTSGVIANFMSK